ncbi:M20/M25/M40 family metallo-hydrolase, partial [Pseudomonas sp. SST3]
MHFPLKKLVAATLFAASLSAVATPASANITADQSAAILKHFSENSATDFRSFLGTLAKSELGKSADTGPAISAFLGNKTLSAEQQNEINRLLGIYTRVKYGKAALETLRELVEIPTFNVDGLPQYKNPEFLKIAAKIEALAKSFNLNFRNVDNRVYEISLEGSGDDVVGVHAHADVVPVTPENWVLQDGTKLDPFKVTLIGDRMYGRGTEDDKNGIVVTM